MNIRAAKSNDVQRIAEIHVRSWQVGYAGLIPSSILDGLSVPERVDRWTERLESQAVLVAETEDGIIGWLAYGASRDEDAEGKVGEVQALYVDPNHWRSGVGQALWEGVRKKFLDHGIKRATLWVLEGNDRARRFYEGIGFVLDPGRSKMWERSGASLPEVRYSRNLEATVSPRA